jgi:hypothetical protein
LGRDMGYRQSYDAERRPGQFHSSSAEYFLL